MDNFSQGSELKVKFKTNEEQYFLCSHQRDSCDAHDYNVRACLLRAVSPSALGVEKIGRGVGHGLQFIVEKSVKMLESDCSSAYCQLRLDALEASAVSMHCRACMGGSRGFPLPAAVRRRRIHCYLPMGPPTAASVQ